MGMNDAKGRVIVATGFHNPHMANLGRTLEAMGCQILYPNQDVDVMVYDAYGKHLYATERQNIEVLRYNQEMLEASGMDWWNATGRVKGILNVSPLLKMFDPRKHVLIMDPRLCLTLAAYSRLNAILLFMDTTNPQANATHLTKVWGMDDEYWLGLQGVYDATFNSSHFDHCRIPDIAVNDRSAIQEAFGTLLAF